MKKLHFVFILVFLFLLSACPTLINHAAYVNVKSQKHGFTLLGNNTAGAPSLADTEKALDIFQKNCKSLFPEEKCKEAISKSTIEWWGVMAHSPASGQVMSVVIYKGKLYSGLTTGYKARVSWRGKFSRSAFAHELMHIVGLLVTGDGDGDHSEATWWDLASKINDELRDSGF